MGVGLNAAPPVGLVPVNSQVYVYPCAAGIAVSPSGKTMIVTNYFNDPISIFSGGYGSWQPVDVATGQPVASNGNPPVSNLDLRPGKSLVSAASGTPGGEYPFWVVIQDTVANDTNDAHAVAYVSSIRDREIDVVPPTRTIAASTTIFPITTDLRNGSGISTRTMRKADFQR